MSNSSQAPSLTLLATLSSPAGRGTRTWQSTPHPSPNNLLLATASSDKSVQVWSLRDFRLLSAISGGHKRSVRCVAWKDYGQLSKRRKAGVKRREKVTLATGSFDANVGIWEHNSSYGKSQINSRADDRGDDELMHDGDSPGDGLELDLTKSREDEEEWNFTTLLTGPDSEVKSIAFSPPHYSANLLATSSRDKSVWVWEEVEDEEWETIAVCQEHTGDVKSVAWCEGARLPKRRKIEDQSPSEEMENGDPDEEEDRIIGSREILASGSYDDTIRLWRDVEEEGDWMCVGAIEGHAGTVWDVCWEKHINLSLYATHDEIQIAAEWEPRILSCSDDMTVRLWRRELSESEKEEKRNQLASNGMQQAKVAPRLPSIIRPPSNFEKWTQDVVLPDVHVRSVYAVDWSKTTGLVVSCGGDGTIAVYREVPLAMSTSSTSTDTQDVDVDADADVLMNGISDESTEHRAVEAEETTPKPTSTTSQWIIAATQEAAHDEYEINHVCWATRRDAQRRFPDEEVIVSTGDDGDVKIWILPEDVIRQCVGNGA